MSSLGLADLLDLLVLLRLLDLVGLLGLACLLGLALKLNLWNCVRIEIAVSKSKIGSVS